MYIEVIEKLSEEDDSIGLNFVHSNGTESTVLFPKKEITELYCELIKTVEYFDNNFSLYEKPKN